MNCKFPAVIFDLDGTLACTLPDLTNSLNSMLAHEGFPTLTHDEIMVNINCGVYDYVRNALPENVRDDEKTVNRCLEVYGGIYAVHYCDETYIYEGIIPLLRILKNDGVWLAIHTNKEHEQAVGIAEKLLPGLFDYVLGDGGIPSIPYKPDPTGAFAVAKKAGIAPEEFAFIGDSHVDMKTAVNAGMYPVGVTWGYRDEETLRTNGAKAIAHDIDELTKLLMTKGEDR